MTESAIREYEPLLPGAHRVIRVLATGEGPYQGVLVANGDDLAVCIDATTLVGWSGWAFAGADHIAAPLDLVRRRDGQDVLLPWCTERITAFVARRRALSESLSAGEVSTLVVSLLRGIAVVGAGVDPHKGEWWLTSTARPVFALGNGLPIEGAAGTLIESLRAQTTDRALLRILGGIVEGLSDLRRAVHHFERWESELLEYASPRPLRAGLRAQERSTRIAIGGEREPLSLAEQAAPFSLDAEPDRGRFWQILEQVSLQIRTAWGRLSARRRGGNSVDDYAQAAMTKQSRPESTRRWARPMLVGGLAAATVIVGGVLWPAGGADKGGSARADTSIAMEDENAPDETSQGAGAIEASPTPKALPVSDATAGQPLDAATSLIADTLACAEGDSAACEAAWYPVRSGAESAVIRGQGKGTPSLIEDYGDLVAVRWDPSDESGAQMLVLIRLNEKWRVQDVYDVADPPSQ